MTASALIVYIHTLLYSSEGWGGEGNGVGRGVGVGAPLCFYRILFSTAYYFDTGLVLILLCICMVIVCGACPNTMSHVCYYKFNYSADSGHYKITKTSCKQLG